MSLWEILCRFRTGRKRLRRPMPCGAGSSTSEDYGKSTVICCKFEEKKKQMLWTARVDSATSQKCSNLVLGIFSSLFMSQGIPQLRLSSENEHFLVGKPSKSHLKQPETHIWSLKSQILLLKNHKNHQKHVFLYFVIFQFYDV